MEFILLTVSLLNLAVIVHIILYKLPGLTEQEPAQVYFLSTECNCNDLSTNTPVEEEKPAPVPKANESHLAWKNQKKIPMTGVVGSSAPGKVPPKPGPLERPPGFAR